MPHGCPAARMIDTRLEVLCKNLKAIESIRDWGKLRVAPLDGAPEADAAADAAPITIDTHRVQIEDRFFEGLQRSRTGDGRRMTLAFIEHVLDQCKALADRAFDEAVAAAPSDDAASLFDLAPLEALQKLAKAVLDANRGLVRLKDTTYADSEQMVIDIGTLVGRADTIAASINRFLIADKPVGAAAGAGAGAAGPWPPL